MRKTWAAALALTLLPYAALAEGNHPMAGCGLAYMLFSKDDNRKSIQILASTTNNIVGIQTFGITSGTSGCTESGTIAKNMEAEVFVEINFRDLQRDMAAGGGEYLNAFVEILGIREAQKKHLFLLFQRNYENMFPKKGTTPMEMLKKVQRELEDHPEYLA